MSLRRLPIEVCVHPQTVDLFDEVERDYPEVKRQLLADFRQYVESGFERRPKRFGKVDLYTRPASVLSAQLMHIHICMPPPKDFPAHLPVARMTCRRNEPHRDASLVYVRGECEDHRYCILGLLYPYAHEQAQDNGLMLRLAALAREFRDNN